MIHISVLSQCLYFILQVNRIIAGLKDYLNNVIELAYTVLLNHTKLQGR